MSRKFLFAAAGTLLLTLAAFGATSYALGSAEPPRLRSNLPAAQLPTFSLPEATGVAINNSIGADGVARFGITPDSYTQVRRLADTAAGTFYLIPGSRGACVVTLSTGAVSAGACGDPGAPDEAMIALGETTSRGDKLVAAGIVTDTTKRVTIERRDGSPVVSLPVARGVFVLHEIAGVKPSVGLRFVSD
jgi:hypothetical protein